MVCCFKAGWVGLTGDHQGIIMCLNKSRFTLGLSTCQSLYLDGESFLFFLYFSFLGQSTSKHPFQCWGPFCAWPSPRQIFFCTSVSSPLALLCRQVANMTRPSPAYFSGFLCHCTYHSECCYCSQVLLTWFILTSWVPMSESEYNDTRLCHRYRGWSEEQMVRGRDRRCQQHSLFVF